MNNPILIHLNQLDSSYLVLVCVGGIGLAAGILFYTGMLGWALRGLAFTIRAIIWHGFLVWERLFAWASWPLFLAFVVGLLAVGWTTAKVLPSLTVVCALIPLFMGLTACLSYMFIDRERYEVERGHKAFHNPLKGQGLAYHLVHYGPQVGVPLLAAAAVGMIGGFVLLNQGLYETIGRSWYAIGDKRAEPTYVDFLAYALIHLLRIVDVLNIAHTHRLLEITYVRPIAWPASTLMTAFQTFFAFILLQQIFASIRQGYLLVETITDFWSPHASIHERARNALPQYGARAVSPLLLSLRSVACLTKEQRDQLPPILAAIGPSAIPALVRHLHDPDEAMRALAVAALGHLRMLDELPLLARLAHDPSEAVRQNVVEALGNFCASSPGNNRPGRRHGRAPRLQIRWMPRWFWWKKGLALTPCANATDLAILTLREALADISAAVRVHAARSLGRIGLPAAAVAPDLIALLNDRDVRVRCEAAESLGNVHGSEEAAVHALIELLQDSAPAVKAAAARALGALRKAAAPAVLGLVPLLQDQDESVRIAAAEAIAHAGSLNGAATNSLVKGLSSPDNVVRAQTAQALGTIGNSAQETAPALVEAMTDPNDRVRAKAVQALGKIGEGAADVAVPGLVRALHDQDNWVSALAAEALGQMGDSGCEAVPALMRALRHINAQVRGNAAESLGKMGVAAEQARRVLESACRDDDGTVRGHAVRALGVLGPTSTSRNVVLNGLQDADPHVRMAAVEAMGDWGETNEAILRSVMPLLEDTNEQVRVQVARVLPKLAGALPEAIAGLCRRLLEDDSVLVQCSAAQALSKLGPSASAAGEPLLRAAQTMDVTVREQAMRAIAMIQPPEAGTAFASGLKDAAGDIRKIASAGWMKAAAIPEQVIPALVEALRDSEIQVRANAAHALARLDALPAAAIPLLIACTTDANDGLRMNAALALKLAAGVAVTQAMARLLEDASLRIRFIAASALFPLGLDHDKAAAVLVEALSDQTLRLRHAALALIKSQGAGDEFLGTLRLRAELEQEPELRDALVQLVAQRDSQIEAQPQTLVTP